MDRWMAGLALIAATGGAGAQVAERKSGAVMAADFDYPATLERCAVVRQGATPIVAGRLHVRFQPDQRLGAASGVDIDVATGADGAPTVSAHAINTKGMGATNHGRMAAQTCAVEPSPAATISGSFRAVRPAATCTIDDGGTVSFAVPVADLAPDAAAKNYTGHVTLMKRGDDSAGARVVAACSAATPMQAQYDLAVAKK